jgi:hypothetical protein
MGPALSQRLVNSRMPSMSTTPTVGFKA